ncbi:hypothetical protein ACTFTM_20580 [Micromonospora sp. RB23]
MAAEAAGMFRRTPIERADQRVAWDRADQAFFAAGACHILAWACRDVYPDKSIDVIAVRHAGEPQVFHVYAAWNGWAFDHSAWNFESQLLAVNTHFEGQPLQRLTITEDLAEFCDKHRHRLPDEYWQDPFPRARRYVGRYTPPWLC